MLDLNKIRSVTMDVANSASSYQDQDEITEVIWTLLKRGYKVYLISTDKNDKLQQEDFIDPALVFLTCEFPPVQSDLDAHPDLKAPTNLWFTDNAELLRWLEQMDMPVMSIVEPRPDRKNRMRISRIAELRMLLDPTALVLNGIIQVVDDMRVKRPAHPVLIGVGGPPLSNFQQFSIDLKTHLQDAEHDLVDLLDLSYLLSCTEDILLENPASLGTWIRPEIGKWVAEEIFKPLIAGKPVYIESAPTDFPTEFSAHFPLYISNESILIVFAELIFRPSVSEYFDISLLLEVSPEESTRRMYEMPSSEHFDPKFTDQYLKREGGIYRQYLEINNVEKKATIRIDANREFSFSISQRTVVPLN